jgi:hypothetical protein
MGGALSAQGHVQGVYEKSGKLTWTHTSSDKALWFGTNGNWMIGPKTEIGGTTGTKWVMLYNPVSSLPYGNGNEFFYWDGAEWVKPINEIEVECTTGPGKGPSLYYVRVNGWVGGWYS